MSQTKHYRRHRVPLAACQNWRCCYCGQGMTIRHGVMNSATVEHVVSKARGGVNALENLVSACFRCNNTRGSRPAMIFACLVAREKWEPNTRPIDHRDRWGVTEIDLDEWTDMNERQKPLVVLADGLSSDVLAKLNEMRG